VEVLELKERSLFLKYQFKLGHIEASWKGLVLLCRLLIIRAKTGSFPEVKKIPILILKRCFMYMVKRNGGRQSRQFMLSLLKDVFVSFLIYIRKNQ
jgi:hypothetical protein